MTNPWGRRIVWIPTIAAIVVAVLWLGTLIHEGAHALVAAACGARVEEMNVLGLDIYPALRVHYRPGYYGYVRFDRRLPSPQVELMAAAGSLSTLAVALLAQVVLWINPPRRRWLRLLVIGFCFSWLDLLYHTLPTMGLRPPFFALRLVERAEAYNALVALGLPAWWLGAAVVAISLMLLVLTLARWLQLTTLEER